MDLLFKNNFPGYFRFYYGIVGNKLFIYLFLSIFISLLDGIGLAMFIPLLQYVNNGDITGSQESLGQLAYLINAIDYLGLTLSITSVLIIIVSIFLIKGSLKYFQLNYYTNLRQSFIKKVRLTLLDNLSKLSFTGFLKLDAGNIQNALTTEVARLFQTMTFYFNAGQSCVMLSTFIILAFLANFQFAILVGIGGLVSNFFYRKIYSATKKASIEISKKGSDFNGFLIQSVYFFKYLKSTNKFRAYAYKIRLVINETEDINRSIWKLKSVILSVKEPVMVVMVAPIIFIHTQLIGTNLNSIILSLLFFYRALGFLSSMQSDWHSFIEYVGAMDSIAQIAHKMHDNKELTEGKTFTEMKISIEFKNVEFYYDKIKIIDNLSLNIPNKKTIALIGESGAGKTTVANMICGLFPPTFGNIYIDDFKLEKYNIESVRSKIGYISQEPVIFNDSIYNNITFWDNPTTNTREKFQRVIEMSSLSQFINSLPEKENTILGDNGIFISGGQRQRISIARELYKNIDILILDEATSALDSETENLIQENIQNLHGKFTIIVIAHRLSTIRNADIIYLLEKGKISDHGSFNEMLYKSSRFQKMVSLQAV